jgi:hypothetical protein
LSKNSKLTFNVLEESRHMEHADGFQLC